MNVLDLFSGIGGFSLGLERAGMRTVAFCEIDPFCRRVLAKHWPGVPYYEDVRTLTAERLRTDGISVDVICGGFPCQDLSSAGRRAGIDGARSGLWSEIQRLSRDLRPKVIVMENVWSLLAGPSEQPGGWFGRVLGDLAALRYDAEWHCIPAAAVGAQHYRDRVWIIAYPDQDGRFHDSPILSGATIVSGVPRLSAKVLGTPTSEWLYARGGLPDLRKHDGISAASHRIGQCGNTVIPQIPELIGRAIMRATA